MNRCREASRSRFSGNFRHMGRRIAVTLAIASSLLAADLLTIPGDAPAGRRGVAYSLTMGGPLLPGAQADLRRGLVRAQARHASLVIVRLDSPGGLTSTAREMAKDISVAPMPVVVFVAPGGARAEEVGLFLTLAGDVAAMDPGTTIGAASPFRLRPPRNEQERRIFEAVERRARNDAIAFARALAETHGRNADLAERIVREGRILSAAEAGRRRLIDVVAASERSLLEKLDGFRLKGPKARELRTAGLSVKQAEADLEPTDSGKSGDRSSLLITLGLVVLLPLAVGAYWFVDRDVWRRRRWLWHRFRTRLRGPDR